MEQEKKIRFDLFLPRDFKIFRFSSRVWEDDEKVESVKITGFQNIDAIIASIEKK